jgi:UPF0716 protein FxsA
LTLPPLDTILKLLRASVPQGASAPVIDPRRLGYYIAIWIGLELLAFSLVVHTLGFIATLVLSLATTLQGLSDIRRLLVFRGGALHDGGLSALGGFLLILPGFVTDLAGLALKSPSVRAGLARRWSNMSLRPNTRDSRADPSVIDLTPHDYRNVDQPKRPARRKRAGSA